MSAMILVAIVAEPGASHKRYVAGLRKFAEGRLVNVDTVVNGVVIIFLRESRLQRLLIVVQEHRGTIRFQLISQAVSGLLAVDRSDASQPPAAKPPLNSSRSYSVFTAYGGGMACSSLPNGPLDTAGGAVLAVVLVVLLKPL